MFRTSRLQKFGVALTTVVAVLALACQEPQAQVKPFKIVGEGIAPFGIPTPGNERPHDSIGNATHLGKYHGLGAVHTTAITGFDPSTGVISGIFGSAVPFVFVAANGDQLACHYGRDDLPADEGGATSIGTFELVPYGDPSDGVYVAFWIADFVPVIAGDEDKCTGKFEGIKGSWTMYAESDPFVLGSTDAAGYSWEGEGFLEFAKKAKKVGIRQTVDILMSGIR